MENDKPKNGEKHRQQRTWSIRFDIDMDRDITGQEIEQWIRFHTFGGSLPDDHILANSDIDAKPETIEVVQVSGR